MNKIHQSQPPPLNPTNKNRLYIIIIISILLIFSAIAIFYSQLTKQCLENNRRGQPGLLITTRQKIVQTIYKEVDIIIDPKDGLIGKLIQKDGAWEPHMLRVLLHFTREGSTILNVGSHNGLEAIVMAKKAGPKSKLYMFEPYSVTHNILVKNLFINNIGLRSTAYNVGCSDKKGTGVYKIDFTNTGASSILKDVSESMTGTQIVQVDRIDDILPKDLVVDFVLMDVQRMQVYCLESFKETIRRSPDIIIFVQWSGSTPDKNDITQRRNDLLDWFVQMDFKFYHHVTGGFCSVSFEEVSLQHMKDIDNATKIGDYFFIPSHIDPNGAFA